MSHTQKSKDKLRLRVRRIVGQLEAVERAIEAEKPCADVLHAIAACRGSINGLMAEAIEDQLTFHVVDPSLRHHPARQKDAAAELMEAIRSYLS